MATKIGTPNAAAKEGEERGGERGEKKKEKKKEDWDWRIAVWHVGICNFFPTVAVKVGEGDWEEREM